MPLCGKEFWLILCLTLAGAAKEQNPKRGGHAQGPEADGSKPKSPSFVHGKNPEKETRGRKATAVIELFALWQRLLQFGDACLFARRSVANLKETENGCCGDEPGFSPLRGCFPVAGIGGCPTRNCEDDSTEHDNKNARP
jgi:hypothetical protein